MRIWQSGVSLLSPSWDQYEDMAILCFASLTFAASLLTLNSIERNGAIALYPAWTPGYSLLSSRRPCPMAFLYAMMVRSERERRSPSIGWIALSSLDPRT